VLVPDTGDYRIYFSAMPTDITVTIVGVQEGLDIAPFEGEMLVREGIVSIRDMFVTMESSDDILVWLSRAGSVVLGIASIACFVHY
jgi:hypothetical protein